VVHLLHCSAGGLPYPAEVKAPVASLVGRRVRVRAENGKWQRGQVGARWQCTATTAAPTQCEPAATTVAVELDGGGVLTGLATAETGSSASFAYEGTGEGKRHATLCDPAAEVAERIAFRSFSRDMSQHHKHPKGTAPSARDAWTVLAIDRKLAYLQRAVEVAQDGAIYPAGQFPAPPCSQVSASPPDTPSMCTVRVHLTGRGALPERRGRAGGE
jgi:hypothetical protein